MTALGLRALVAYRDTEEASCLAKDAYQTLGVGRDADKEAIKLAYYDLRKRYAALKRPTRAQTERLVRINAAWDILKIAERKADHDAELTRAEKAKREREEAAAAKPEAPPSPPPKPERRPVEEDATIHSEPRRKVAPRRGHAKSAPSAIWKLGTAVGAIYIFASLMKPNPSTVPPAPVATAEAPALKKGPSKLASKKARRKVSVAGRVHRRSSSNQDVADMNRRELERLRQEAETKRAATVLQ